MNSKSETIKEAKRHYVLHALSRYWIKGYDAIQQLPIPTASELPEPLPPKMKMVQLPEWGSDIGVNEGLLVPAHFIMGTNKPQWKQVDWFAAAFWYLNGAAEREFEKRNGPIHSYSSKLKGWDKRIWQRAWVNRIALFLRKWGSQGKNVSEEKKFGKLPAPEIIITHDVDAVKKTDAIRFKQSVFHLINFIRLATQGHWENSFSKFKQAFKFLISNENYWCFDKIIQIENKFNIKSFFNFYAGPGGKNRNSKQMLFDPAYDITVPELSNIIKKLHSDGWHIGLHQSFDTWDNLQRMRVEKDRLEKSLGHPVIVCRQHWLRFSWEKTWKTQQDAGLLQDTTLGFNDRPGFRNASALHFHPWDGEENKALTLSAIPLVLMDSHLFDYQILSEEKQKFEMQYWLDEIKAVNGTATIVWHQQVMNDDYGWYEGYVNLLKILTKDN